MFHHITQCLSDRSTAWSRLALMTVVFGCLGGLETAAEVRSTGLAAGDPIGAFRVVKVAGADDDGVSPGDALCYRCRYGSSPMVMVFARKSSKELISLVQKLDRALERNKAERLRSFVTFLGEDSSELKKAAADLSEEVGPIRLPIVVSQDAETGPPEYRIPPGANTTVIVAQDSRVVAFESFSDQPIAVEQVMSQLDKMLSADNEQL